jgi:hypothetical protein
MRSHRGLRAKSDLRVEQVGEQSRFRWKHSRLMDLQIKSQFGAMVF